MGFQSVIRDLVRSWSTVQHSDASAPLGVTQRQGLGNPRHVDCSFLFVQSLKVREAVQCAKTPGSDNPADVCTEGLNAELMTKHVSAVDGRYSAGIPTFCLGVLGMLDSVEQCCRTGRVGRKRQKLTSSSLSSWRTSRRKPLLQSMCLCCPSCRTPWSMCRVACIMKDVQEVVVDIFQTSVCERTGGNEHQIDHETDCNRKRTRLNAGM